MRAFGGIPRYIGPRKRPRCRVMGSDRRFSGSGTALQGLLRAGLVLLIALLPPSARSQESVPAAPRYVKPSVEELAIPQPPIESNGDSGTAETICLMLESAAR